MQKLYGGPPGPNCPIPSSPLSKKFRRPRRAATPKQARSCAEAKTFFLVGRQDPRRERWGSLLPPQLEPSRTPRSEVHKLFPRSLHEGTDRCNALPEWATALTTGR